MIGIIQGGPGGLAQTLDSGPAHPVVVRIDKNNVSPNFLRILEVLGSIPSLRAESDGRVGAVLDGHDLHRLGKLAGQPSLNQLITLVSRDSTYIGDESQKS